MIALQSHTFSRILLRKTPIFLICTTRNATSEHSISEHQSGSIVIERAGPVILPQLWRLMKHTYYLEDPAFQALSLHGPEIKEDFVEWMNTNAVSRGCSVVAKNKINDEIVCAGINMPISRHSAHEYRLFATTFHDRNLKRILEYWAQLQEVDDFWKIAGDVPTAFEMAQRGTARRARGRGILLRVFRKSLELAYDLRYDVIKLTCTSMVMVNMARNHGLREIRRIPFKDFQHTDGSPLFSSPPLPPRDKVYVMALFDHLKGPKY